MGPDKSWLSKGCWTMGEGRGSELRSGVVRGCRRVGEHQPGRSAYAETWVAPAAGLILGGCGAKFWRIKLPKSAEDVGSARRLPAWEHRAPTRLLIPFRVEGVIPDLSPLLKMPALAASHGDTPGSPLQDPLPIQIGAYFHHLVEFW